MDFSGPSGSLSAQDNCDSVSTLCSEGKGSKGGGNTSFSETHKRRGLPQLAEYCGMPHALRHEGTSPQRRGGWKLRQGRQGRARAAAGGRQSLRNRGTPLENKPGNNSSDSRVPQTKQEMSSNSPRFCSYFLWVIL